MHSQMIVIYITLTHHLSENIAIRLRQAPTSCFIFSLSALFLDIEVAGIEDIIDVFPDVLQPYWILDPTRMDQLSELVLPRQFHYHYPTVTLEEDVNLQKKQKSLPSLDRRAFSLAKGEAHSLMIVMIEPLLPLRLVKVLKGFFKGHRFRLIMKTQRKHTRVPVTPSFVLILNPQSTAQVLQVELLCLLQLINHRKTIISNSTLTLHTQRKMIACEWVNSHIQMLRGKKNNKAKEKSSKSRNKRILTIYSAQGSTSELLAKGGSLPLKKVNKSSVSNLNPKHKQPKRQKTRHQTVAMKSRPPQEYEKIPICFVSSNTNSQIEFSNYGETRKDRPKRILHIDCDQQALLKQIWRQERRKDNVQHRAAVKIQKVARGYLTRKLLMKYVQEYEEKLLRQRDNLAHLRGETSRERENPLDLESSIMIASPSGNSIVEEEELPHSGTYDRRENEPQRDSLTLNESIIARQQEISMSFGQENQHSPHFVHVPRLRNSKDISRSPAQEERKHNHFISDQRTGDGFSQNISSCPSQSKPARPKEESSAVKEQVQGAESLRQSSHLQNLRCVERAKWEQVIDLVHAQLREGVDQHKTRDLMAFILEFSVKNREELNQKSYQVTPTTITHRQEELQPTRPQPTPTQANFKKKKPQMRGEEIRKAEGSILQRTSSMKEYFLKNLCIQDQQIDKMMSLRQAVLRRRESNSLVELNRLLQDNALSQDAFLERMTSLTSTFLQQKKDIQQTKEEIYQGYRAQLQLFKHTILDAKYLGYHIPFCRSMEIYPAQPKWRFDSLLIDELDLIANRRARNQDQLYQLPQLTTRKIDQMLEDRESFKQPDQEAFNSESQEDSVNFSYEETNLYNDPQAQPLALSPKNMKKVNAFNRYSTIALNQDFTLQARDEKRLNTSEEKVEEEEEEEYLSLRRMPKKETFKIEYSSDQEEVALYQESNDKQTQELVGHCFQRILYDLLEDCFKVHRIVDAFGLTRPGLRRSLQAVTKQQRLDFISNTVSLLPSFTEVSIRLNQKMYPNARQLLVSMREEVQGTDSQHEYYEIGHYQYILNQEICFEAIERYINQYQQKIKELAEREKSSCPAIVEAELQQYGSAKLRKNVKSYGERMQVRTEEAQELRGEVLKIELHLVLDAWNELLIRHRQNKVGYSGIGLNQISFSLIDRVCRPLNRAEDWNTMITSTRRQLQEMIRNEVLHEKLMKQYEEFVSDNDSQWILYAQEGLQYGFDLAKALEVELIFELLEELHILNEDRNEHLSIQQEEQEEDQDSESEPDDSQSSLQSQHLQLNEDEQHQLQKKMQKMASYPDSDDSLYD